MSDFGTMVFEGRFSVNKNGDVFCWKSGYPKKKKQYLSGRYLAISVDGKNIKIHRLVARTFLGEPPEGKKICAHKNDNPLDNRLENLYWANHEENANDAKLNGVLAINKRQGNSNLNKYEVLGIIKAFENGYTKMQISKELGISHTNVSDLILGNSWKNITTKNGEQIACDTTHLVNELKIRSEKYIDRKTIEISPKKCLSLAERCLELEEEVEGYRSGNLPTWKSEYDLIKSVCDEVDKNNEELRAENIRLRALVANPNLEEWYLKSENLRMVCIRLARAKTIEKRDQVASKCKHLFSDVKDILRGDEALKGGQGG